MLHANLYANNVLNYVQSQNPLEKFYTSIKYRKLNPCAAHREKTATTFFTPSLNSQFISYWMAQMHILQQSTKSVH